ncbi:hypothetical protein ARMSODRAFT_178129 [Armillaria solidipes]|uniref:Uncharacterized protein n=1 Tax=Armillaria solidipes TaxID=1076256 RepID=A0A2H3BQD2_9AGAR|nr:hypothetical protein ARMSODRAFT_178129 [Armillaria solidipes]
MFHRVRFVWFRRVRCSVLLMFLVLPLCVTTVCSRFLGLWATGLPSRVLLDVPLGSSSPTAHRLLSFRLFVLLSLPLPHTALVFCQTFNIVLATEYNPRSCSLLVRLSLQHFKFVRCPWLATEGIAATWRVVVCDTFRGGTESRRSFLGPRPVIYLSIYLCSVG